MVRKIKRNFSLDPQTIELAGTLGERFYGSASAALEEAVLRLAREHGLLPAAKGGGQGLRYTLREVFQQVVSWAWRLFQPAFFEAHYHVAEDLGPNGCMVWEFRFDLPTYRERVGQDGNGASVGPLEGSDE